MSIDLYLYSGNIPKEITAEQLNDWFIGSYTQRRHTYREILNDITEYDFVCYGEAREKVREYFFNIWKQGKEEVSKSDFNNVYFEITPSILTEFGNAIVNHLFGDYSVEGALMKLGEIIGIEFDYGNRVFIMLNW